jgi:hypothetical protein
MSAEVLAKTEATLNAVPDLLRVLKPAFIALTFFESEHQTLPCVFICPYHFRLFFSLPSLFSLFISFQ